jgi:glycosyltransferase involved in cell wall biosynthesis
MVYAAWLGSHPATIAVKYMWQWWQTSRLLAHERPRAVFVMAPPVFAALPAFWYAWRHDAQVVIDAHTCAFVLPRWRSLQWLQRWCCRRARTTLVTNDHIAAVVRAAGGHATLVPDVPVQFPGDRRYPRTCAFTVAVVCSFADDEPTAVVLEAAARLPDVRMYLSGDAGALPASIRARVPANVTLTGFLDTATYGSLISDTDVVVDLTTADHTMLRGAYEAIYQGVPVIVSDWPLLRASFPIGAVHVANTPDALVAAIGVVQMDLTRLRAEAARLRDIKRAAWEVTRRRIEARVGPFTP